MIEILVARVFNTRNVAHLTHLKTKSYAQHMALNSFYEDVVGDADAVVEAYQGAFGLIDIPYLPAIKVPSNMVKHLEDEVAWIGTNRSAIAKDLPAIENLIDTLTETYLSTIYKLKFLA
jgi:hypothetical protein